MRRMQLHTSGDRMSLHPSSPEDVPWSTAVVARAAFPHGDPYLKLRDEVGTVFRDAQFAALFASRGQPAEAPWRLALAIVLQFAEDLSDRRAADAVRSRIDWKYLLGLALSDAGFDASVLSEFRSRLVAGGAEEQLLTSFLALYREKKLLRTRGRQRTDATHVLDACLFATLAVVRVETEAWLTTHNTERPHDSLGEVQPLTFLPQALSHPRTLQP